MTSQEKKPLKPHVFTVRATVYSTDPKRARKLLVWALWSAGIRAESATIASSVEVKEETP